MALRPLLAVALLLASVLAAGCSAPGEPLPPEWKGRDLREPGWANGTLQTGWTMGLEYSWPSGQSVQWDWLTTDGKVLYFQIVRMEDGQPQAMVGQHRDNSTGRITTPVSGAYQLVFRNEGFSDAALWYKVPEGYAQRLYPPGQGPSCFIRPDGAGGRVAPAAASC
jgi:hypothetical protein